MPEWLIVAIKEYLFVKETLSSTVMGTTTCLFDLLWVQLKKFVSSTSGPPWLEDQQSSIIKTVYTIGFSGAFRKSPAQRAKPFILWW